MSHTYILHGVEEDSSTILPCRHPHSLDDGDAWPTLQQDHICLISNYVVVYLFFICHGYFLEYI